ncbi:protein kinase domain-containing protein [Actinomadura terrae]|uniref:protein kinase domain-containing protein n=1 Tax=Actinomadura terrae TaxID=604353 RepID=UPI001FA80933|nr:hypothetical protein [Actinomadura terrae]
MQSPAPPPAYEPLRPGDPALVGGYRVLARLRDGAVGDAGAGTVYVATTQSGLRLAIRRFPSRLADDPGFRSRLNARIAAVQRVRSPHLAAVFDGHADETGAWVATEHAPGPSLARAVAEAGALPVPAVRTLARSLAEALQALHDAGIAHGDVTASTVHLIGDGPRLDALGAPDPAGPPADDVPHLGRVALHAATGRYVRDDAAGLDACPDELRDPIARCLAGEPDRLADLDADAPGPGWLPSDVAALLPAYRAEPPGRDVPAAGTVPAARLGRSTRPIILPPAAPPPHGVFAAPPVTRPDLRRGR